MVKLKQLIKSNLPNLRYFNRKRKNGLKTCLGPDNYSYRMFFSSFKNTPNIKSKCVNSIYKKIN